MISIVVTDIFLNNFDLLLPTRASDSDSLNSNQDLEPGFLNLVIYDDIFEKILVIETNFDQETPNISSLTFQKGLSGSRRCFYPCFSLDETFEKFRYPVHSPTAVLKLESAV